MYFACGLPRRLANYFISIPTIPLKEKTHAPKDDCLPAYSE